MRIVGTTVKPAMELGVEILIVLLGPQLHHPRRSLMLYLQRAALGCGHSFGREPGADRLQLGHALEHRGKMLLRHDSDDSAPVRPPFDQAHGAELAERLPDRGA